MPEESGNPENAGADRTLVIDPRDFISPPFASCPACGRTTLGVLMIARSRVIRRCRMCGHKASRELPTLRKKVIYLDQFTVSNMMKALNPKAHGNRSGVVPPSWRELFRRLETTAKQQLIICPDSEFHRRESAVMSAPLNAALQRMIEQFSGGATFYPAPYIEQSQLLQHVRNWLSGKPEVSLRTIADDVVMGDLHGWWDRLRATVDWDVQPEWVEELSRVEKETDEALPQLAEKWRKQRRSFKQQFSEEVRAYGIGLIKAALQQLGSSHAITLRIIQRTLTAEGMSPESAWKKTLEYLGSEALQHVPFVKISAMLFAATTRKILAGQKRPPTSSLLSDVTVVSLYLPYCDAMLIDNELAAYLHEEPLATELRYPARIFSPNTLGEFMEYLDGLEKAAPTEHRRLVREVYGDTWTEPFEDMYH